MGKGWAADDPAEYGQGVGGLLNALAMGRKFCRGSKSRKMKIGAPPRERKIVENSEFTLPSLGRPKSSDPPLSLWVVPPCPLMEKSEKLNEN